MQIWWVGYGVPAHQICTTDSAVINYGIIGQRRRITRTLSCYLLSYFSATQKYSIIVRKTLLGGFDIQFRIHSETRFRFSEKVRSIYQVNLELVLLNLNPDLTIEYPLLQLPSEQHIPNLWDIRVINCIQLEKYESKSWLNPVSLAT